MFSVGKDKVVDSYYKSVLIAGNEQIKITRTESRISNNYVITGKGSFCSINRLA